MEGDGGIDTLRTRDMAADFPDRRPQDRPHVAGLFDSYRAALLTKEFKNAEPGWVAQCLECGSEVERVFFLFCHMLNIYIS